MFNSRLPLKRLILPALVALLGLEVKAQQRSLDVTSFIVVGEGLAAGMADFSLSNFYQDKSFPVQMARQMSTILPQPLIQPPGIGFAPGFPALPVRIPGSLQTTVRESGPDLFVFNISVPGAKVADALNRRPQSPLIQEFDVQQTVTNFLLGFPALLVQGAPLWSQIEYAERMRPTVALVELGYYDVLDAATKGDAGLLPDVSTFHANYSQILSRLKNTSAEVIVTTVPDPMDTAYFISPESATNLVGAPAEVLRSLYRLNAGDVFTVNGITAVATQISARNIQPLPSGSVLSVTIAAQITARVKALNSDIVSMAQQNGSVLYDLYSYFNKVKNSGVAAGTRTLAADYLTGGFYSLDGYYPGFTGQALIANELLALINQTYGKSFQPVDVATLAADDPATANGSFSPSILTLEQLQQLIPNLTEVMGKIRSDRRRNPVYRNPGDPGKGSTSPGGAARPTGNTAQGSSREGGVR